MIDPANKSKGITRKFKRTKSSQGAVSLNMGRLNKFPTPDTDADSDCEVREFSQESGWQQWQGSADDGSSSTSYAATIPMPLVPDESIDPLAVQLDAFASVTRNSA